MNFRNMDEFWPFYVSQQQECGILQAHLPVLCVSCTALCLTGATCFACLWLAMVWPGIVISSSKGMFPRRLVIRSGLFYAITRCLDWCSLVRWTKKSKGLVRDQCSKLIDICGRIGWSWVLALTVTIFKKNDPKYYYRRRWPWPNILQSKTLDHATFILFSFLTLHNLVFWNPERFM